MPNQLPELAAELLTAAAYPHTTSDIEVIETHISWVLLTGEFAYKIKKPVTQPFLDFSTLEQREHFCREELRLNARLAPELYLDVVPIGGTPEQPRVGNTPAFEYAVRMRQFDVEASADRLIQAEANALGREQLEALADRMAAFHDALEPVSDTRQHTAILKNLAETRDVMADSDRPGLQRLLADTAAAVARLANVFAERSAAGRVRDCHGDLHLGNIALIGEQLIPFDCLEFDPRLRTIDLIDEIAFLFMDLASHGRHDLAFAFLNRWLERTGDFAGLALLRLYAAHRALVRVKVSAISARESADPAAVAAGERYLRAAESALAESSGRLLLMMGLSGSGKTTVAREIAGLTGAVHVRSDVERKRLCSLDPLADARAAPGAGIYSRETTAATYDALLAAAQAALAGGLTIIVDATFLAHAQRQRFAELAAACDAPSRILHCTAAESTLRERVRQRAQARGDASDADESVLDRQLATADALSAAEEAAALTIDTGSALDYDAIVSRI